MTLDENTPAAEAAAAAPQAGEADAPAARPRTRRRAATRPAGPPAEAPAEATPASPGDTSSVDRPVDGPTDQPGADQSAAGQPATEEPAGRAVEPAPAPRKRARRATKAATAETSAPDATIPAPTADAGAPAEAPAEAPADEAPAPKRRRARKTAAPTPAATAQPADQARPQQQPAEPVAEPAGAEPAGAQLAGEEPADDQPTESTVGLAAAPAVDAGVSPAPEQTEQPAVLEPGPVVAAGVPMPIFQAPEPTPAPRARRRAASRPAGPPQHTPVAASADERPQQQDVPEEPAEEIEVPVAGPALEDTADVDVDELEDVDDIDDTDDAEDTEDTEDEADEEASEGGRRRRRRRGGRGRRSRAGRGDEGETGDAAASDEDEAPAADEGDADEGDDEDEAEAEGGEAASSRRRRRRRRRSGSSDEPAPDDPPNTVVRVRESRRSSGGGGGDGEVSGVRGSTRLEAKKMRRREGREAGRRRPLITEAEFLARRESVDRVMVVRERDGRTQIGVLEDGVLVEHYVARRTQTSMAGNVYLGRVQNVLPSMEAAFVDIGKGRNAVLYAGEVNWDAAGLEGQPKRIEHALKAGESVLVQVTKDPIGHKGARLTSQVSLPGRYLVYVPDGSMTGISRKLPDNERARLKKVLRDVVPDNAGVIVRTAAEGAAEEELERDVARLQAQWEDISRKAGAVNAPALLYGEPDLAIRVVRDIFNEDFAKLVISGDDAWDTLQSYIGHVAPDLVGRLERWEGDGDVFASYRIDEQLAKALDRKVFLPSGGSLVIDRTEAMTVVDVNTGKFTGAGGNLEETVTRNNLEAAEEVVRQLRLRDIGGIIVVDFIDMVLESNRELVMRRLLECLGRDRTKHQVAEVTSLGLVQMTRKRVGSGLLEVFSETCEHCGGRGVILHDEPVEKRQPEGGGGRPRPSYGGGSSADEQHGEQASGGSNSGSSGGSTGGSSGSGGGSNGGGGGGGRNRRRRGGNSGNSGNGAGQPALAEGA